MAWLRRPRKKTGGADLAWLGTAVVTSSGEVRPENQDRAVVARITSLARRDQVHLLMLLCDGMGGMVDGGQCADIAISAFLESTAVHAQQPIMEILRRATLDANQAVFRTYRGRGGTTLTAALFTGSTSAAVSVGDSRLYQISRSRQISQVSVDDTIAGELRRIHGTEPNELEAFSNRLAQFIGIGDGLEPRSYILNPHDNWYLICTDGIQAIPENTISKIVSSAETTYAIANRLTYLSAWCGGNDNASAICFGSPPAKAFSNPQESRNNRLEVWDSFSSTEFVFISADASQTNSPFIAQTKKTPASAPDWKKARSPKFKRKRTTKKAKPERADVSPGPPKQFEMEIVEGTPQTPKGGPEEPDQANRK